MNLHQAVLSAEKKSRDHKCTVYLCADFKFYRLSVVEAVHGQPASDTEIPFKPAEIDPNGYHTCDFYDGTVIARCVDGEWREM